MYNFSDAWKKFLFEDKKIETKPRRHTFLFEEDEDILTELDEEEKEVVDLAIRAIDFNDLAFNGLFGDKMRLIVDFPVATGDEELSKFVSLFERLGYTANWEKGTISGIRPKGLPDGSVRDVKVQMKIGKFLSKLLQYRKNIQEIYQQKKIDNKKAMEARKKGESYERMDIINNEDLIRNRKLIAHLASESADGFVIPPALQTVEGILGLQKYWMKNAEFIKDNIGQVDDETYSIIITRHPLDIWRMSDFEEIQSCHSPPSRGGESTYYKCAVAESHGHGAVAYVVRTEDILDNFGSGTVESAENDPEFQSHTEEVFYDDMREEDSGPITPLSRARFRQMKYYDSQQTAKSSKRFQTGTELAVPEHSVYGEDMIGFIDRLTSWGRESQQEAMNKAPRRDGALMAGNFVRFGGSYHDSPGPTAILADFFNVEKTVGRVEIDTTTEDTLDSSLIDTPLFRVEREVAEGLNEYRHRLAHVEVDAEARDYAFPGGNEAIIEIAEADMIITFKEQEIESFPDAEGVSNILSELKEQNYGSYDWIEEDYTTSFGRVDGKPALTIGIKVTELEDLKGEGGAGQDQYNTGKYFVVPGYFDVFMRDLMDIDNSYSDIKTALIPILKQYGVIEGSVFEKFAKEVYDEDLEYYEWTLTAEEDDYQPGAFDWVIAEADVEIDMDDLGISEDLADKIVESKDFWPRLQEALVSPSFPRTACTNFYPKMIVQDGIRMSGVGMLGSLSVHIAFEVTEQSQPCDILNLRDVLEENDDSDELEELVRSVVLSFVPQQAQQPQGDQAMEDEITEIDDLYGDTLDEKKKKKKKSSGKKDACYHKVKSRYKVWPSAYASGALVKCRKVGAKNWGNSKKEHLQSIIEDEIARDMLLEKRKYRQDKDYDARQLRIGTKHEFEHTKDPVEAEKIAKDHLDEDPMYYVKLKRAKIDEKKKKKRKLTKKPSSETSLRDWFKRKGAPGKKGGWVDCNTCRKDKKTGRKKCSPCGRSGGEKRAKYPSCRPTPAACGKRGKYGKKSKAGKKG
jgi:hypothetical protein